MKLDLKIKAKPNKRTTLAADLLRSPCLELSCPWSRMYPSSRRCNMCWMPFRFFMPERLLWPHFLAIPTFQVSPQLVSLQLTITLYPVLPLLNSTVHHCDVWGIGDTALCIHKFFTRQRCMISVMPWPLCTEVRNPWYALDRVFDSPHSPSGHIGCPCLESNTNFLAVLAFANIKLRYFCGTYSSVTNEPDLWTVHVFVLWYCHLSTVASSFIQCYSSSRTCSEGSHSRYSPRRAGQSQFL